MTVHNDDTIEYKIPPNSIFNLTLYNIKIGEQIICISDHNMDSQKIGEIDTIIEENGNGYFHREKYKDQPCR